MHNKKIWIMNHYATDNFYNKGGRHYWFAENLIKNGYEPTIFCANTRHNSNDVIHIDHGKFASKVSDTIPFVFVKTSPYHDNGIDRIKNMLSFYKNLFPVAKEIANQYGKPDVILASSVHPLTLVAGIKIAKKLGVPCICEVRDLWPESIVAYGILKRENPFAKLLYQGEKWIYKKADAIIMSWEGGKDYIVEQGWDTTVDVSKVYHISNGVVLDTFDQNSTNYPIEDADLENNNYKNVVYTGSIRKVNNLGALLDAAKIIQQKGNQNIRFLIYGSGNELDMLEKRCEDEKINNVIFKGQVEKKQVPAILKKATINILHNSSTSLDRFGQSQNKLFEYLAAGKCIVQTYTTGYSVIEKYHCGISAPKQTPEDIAKAVITACSNEEETIEMGNNARNAAYDFDFSILTNKLINIVEHVTESEGSSNEPIR
ncbi:Glycosyltransferase involved in cell wall bisynthesis [Oceanobacillus limi]|uniref:Glycosyltransferase involved in cell wall bisynthesis n=1 Tax=Oceanobacillus limi TaxID=930131 RepID=A0A1I0A513_9BACI|nr:glycosyltransferase family 4 protein [Oceanobacillus limi]SES88294.1 Glycosyltransferase involved in cell wall bisynthesis [Oceanobacillus limi]